LARDCDGHVDGGEGVMGEGVRGASQNMIYYVSFGATTYKW